MVYKLSPEELRQLCTLRNEIVTLTRVETMMKCAGRLVGDLGLGGEAVMKSLEAVCAVQALVKNNSQRNYLDKVRAVKNQRGVMEDIKFNFEEGTFSVV